MAQKTRAQIVTEITTLLADNTTGAISAEDVRSVLTDIKDSFVNLDDDDSDDITEGVVKLFLTVAERAKLANVPSDTNTELAGKADLTGATFTNTIEVLNAVPIFRLNDRGASSNERKTNLSSNNGALRIQNLNTSDVGGSDYAEFTRSGNNMTAFILYDNAVAKITLNNSGAATFEGLITANAGLNLSSLTASRYLFLDGSNNVTVKTGAEIVTDTGALTEIVQDTTPQLGGNLDAQSNNISSVADLKATNYIAGTQVLTSSAGAVEMVLRQGNFAKITLTESTSFGFADYENGQTAIVKVTQDTTTRILEFQEVLWEGGSAPTITEASGAVDLFRFTFIDDLIYGEVIGQNFS